MKVENEAVLPAPAVAGALAIAAAGVALLPALAPIIPNVWYRMATSGGLLAAVSVAFLPLPWRRLFRPTPRAVIEGIGAAVALYALGAAVFLLLRHVPGAATQVHALYAWRDAVPRGAVYPLLVFIILAEEIVWRVAITLPLVARLGPWAGVAAAALACAAAHVSLGVPVLVLAALGAGGYWSALLVKTRSAVPALVSHLLWDLAVLFVWPYPAVLG
jgi:membrane protease YdiL (CAAX protease family)